MSFSIKSDESGESVTIDADRANLVPPELGDPLRLEVLLLVWELLELKKVINLFVKNQKKLNFNFDKSTYACLPSVPDDTILLEKLKDFRLRREAT